MRLQAPVSKPTLPPGHETKLKKSLETPFNKFCKYALGMPSYVYARTTTVLRELDKTPLHVNAYLNSISYWHRLETKRNTESLLDAAYQECKRNRHDFHENANYLLTLNGLGQIALNPQMFNIKQVKKIVKQCLSDQCRQNINSRIEEEDRFITLRKCINNTSNTDNV